MQITGVMSWQAWCHSARRLANLEAIHASYLQGIDSSRSSARSPKLAMDMCITFLPLILPLSIINRHGRTISSRLIPECGKMFRGFETSSEFENDFIVLRDWEKQKPALEIRLVPMLLFDLIQPRWWGDGRVLFLAASTSAYPPNVEGKPVSDILNFFPIFEARKEQ